MTPRFSPHAYAAAQIRSDLRTELHRSGADYLVTQVNAAMRQPFFDIAPSVNRKYSQTAR
jgi:hypothetical protein